MENWREKESMRAGTGELTSIQFRSFPNMKINILSEIILLNSMIQNLEVEY